MNDVFAALILGVWFIMVLALSWDVKMSKIKNVLLSCMIMAFLGLIYWVPFWLIFLK